MGTDSFGKAVKGRLYIGCAGWTIPGEHRPHFPEAGSHLERYAARFPAVEINTSFYRAIRPATYARWAEGVPEGFRFAVKVPRQITHFSRLKETSALDPFLSAVRSLGEKPGPLPLQLPPSLSLDIGGVRPFLQVLRERFSGEVACEARHSRWFTAEGEALLREFQIARVAVDPPLLPEAGQEAGPAWPTSACTVLLGCTIPPTRPISWMPWPGRFGKQPAGHRWCGASSTTPQQAQPSQMP